jgi:ferredoxin
MADTTLTREIRQVSIDAGAALVGFAAMSRFDNAPPQYHPNNIFPQAKTLIAVAFPQLRATLKTVEEGTYWQAYNVSSYYYLNDVMAPHMLRKICLALEAHGYMGLPVHNPFYPDMGRKVRKEHVVGPDAMLSLRIAGVAAGLGEFGLHKLLLTPEYGPRQRVFVVLTDAELEQTPLFRGRICDECKLCVKGCQANAIGLERSEKIVIEDVVYAHAPLDAKRCFEVHQQGVDPRYNPFRKADDHSGEMYPFGKKVLARFSNLTVCAGRGCIRSCLDHLEKTGRIKAQFKTPMIDKERWDVIP